MLCRVFQFCNQSSLMDGRTWTVGSAIRPDCGACNLRRLQQTPKSADDPTHRRSAPARAPHSREPSATDQRAISAEYRESPQPDVSCPMTQASVLRTSSTGSAASLPTPHTTVSQSRPVPRDSLTHLHQRLLNVARLFRVVQIFGNCWSESLRPNQVFHQKRNGIRQINHAVRKKESFWVRDMPGFLRATVTRSGVRRTRMRGHR